MHFHGLDQLEARGRRVLLRGDLNVPMENGTVTDRTRLEKLCPTIRALHDKGARIIICSHFGSPKGKPVAALSLRPVAEALQNVLGLPVHFAGACVGPAAQQAACALADGDVLLLENTRFDPREETNDPAFARELAALADFYVSDAFSAAHRAHASTEGVAHLLPAYAGRLMQVELDGLDAVLGHPRHPVAAVVGGCKVASKLGLLGNLVDRVDVLVLGGAMANTFLAAKGVNVGCSIQEPDMHRAACEILARAANTGCEVMLPLDVVVAGRLAAAVPSHAVLVDQVPADAMILDLGPATMDALLVGLAGWRSLVWNGPLGAFETPPFDAATFAFAHGVAQATQAGHLTSVAGGGDTVAALNRAGVANQLTYVSTAGGAFLEWLEGRVLPGVAALECSAA